MKIVFMGSPAFALPCLERLKSLGRMPALVVSQPDRPAGRGRKLTPPPVRQWADQNQVAALQPVKLDAEAFDQIAGVKPDLAIVVAYGKILSQKFIDLPRFGSVNVHASLLPVLRGAAPIQWSIINGEKVTGVTLQKVVLELDAGPILHTLETPLKPSTTGGELTRILSEKAADILEVFLKSWDGNSPLQGKPQDPQHATYAPKIDATTRTLDWNLPAPRLEALVRAFSPDPGSRTSDEQDQVWQVLRAEALSAFPGKVSPGLVQATDSEAMVAAGNGTALRLLEIKAPGGKAMSVADFLRGRRLPLAFRASRQ